MDPLAEAPVVFAETRATALALGRSLSPDEAAVAVPSCPGWTLRDVFAHVTGILDDLLHNRLEGLGSDAWTNAQVSARVGRPLAQLCDEYEEVGPHFDAFVTANPGVGTIGGLTLPMRVTADLTVHLTDIAAALGRPADRTSRALRVTLSRYAPAFVERVDAAGLAQVCVVEAGPTDPQHFGPTDAGTLTVRAETYDLVRSLAGRRTQQQIETLAWSADPSRHAPLFSAYGLPSSAGE